MMNSLTAILLAPPLPPPLPHPPLLSLPLPSSIPTISLTFSRRATLRPIPSFPSPDRAAATADIDMVRNPDGIFSACPQKVVVLWDLDNKPPRGPPYAAAVALRRVAELFGRVVDFSAYANRHAFVHLPQWVLAQRLDRRRADVLERKGLSVPDEPYVCGVCGRKCRTNLDLKKHFRQLHERERQKKLARMRSLKGKKRQKYKERFVSGNHKYEEAARELLKPKTGYGLASELRRAGVFVKTVEDKPQAADSALKRQMQHSMARGIDWLLLVSDDSDFIDMIRRARESDLRTVVIGDGRKALGQHADLWVPWVRVENGEVGEEELLSLRNEGLYEGEEQEEDDKFFSSASFYENSYESDDFDGLADEIVVRNSGFGGVMISSFSEEEEVVVEDGENMAEDLQNDLFRIFGSSLPHGDLFWNREEEEDGYI